MITRLSIGEFSRAVGLPPKMLRIRALHHLRATAGERLHGGFVIVHFQGDVAQSFAVLL